MQIKSEFHVRWEDYIKKNPDIADIKSARIIDEYEEGVMRFVLGLFV